MQHDLINEEVIKNIVKEVVSGYQTMPPKKTGQNDVEVLVEASGRHVTFRSRTLKDFSGRAISLHRRKIFRRLDSLQAKSGLHLSDRKMSTAMLRF